LDGSIRFSKPRSIQELRGIAKGMKGKMTTGIENDRFSELVLVDSTGWLEYITGDENADAVRDDLPRRRPGPGPHNRSLRGL